MHGRFPTTLATILFALFSMTVGILFIVHRPPAHHYDCAADRRALEIGIDSYRSRFGPTTEPTRAQLKQQGVIDSVDKAYTYIFMNGQPHFEAVSGTGCK